MLDVLFYALSEPNSENGLLSARFGMGLRGVPQPRPSESMTDIEKRTSS